jgi:cysteine desulfurase / selenocysteine lyase
MLKTMINVKEDFPILKRQFNRKPLVYLDSAATSQKPIQVIEALKNFYENNNSNVHRGVHKLSQEATEMYDQSRKKIADFVSAEFEEIVFVKNSTEAINTVLYSWARKLQKGDEIISTVMEHHSNIVPWQSLKENGVKINFLDIDENGLLRTDQLSEIMTKNTKLVAITHVSNVLGTINDIKEISRIAHDNESLVLVDGAQSVPHMPVNVKDIGADFMVFSGHKMLAPTGIGCLYGKKEIMESMPPFQLGSDMIKEVYLNKATFREIPWKFEPGTPNFGGAIALGAAVDYLKNIGMKNIRDHEKELVEYSLKKLQEIEGIKLYGPLNANSRGGVISFNLGDIHSHDMASVMDEEGVAIRSGHHCAMPLMKRLSVPSVSRASYYVYNTKDDVDRFLESIEKAKKIFRI